MSSGMRPVEGAFFMSDADAVARAAGCVPVPDGVSFPMSEEVAVWEDAAVMDHRELLHRLWVPPSFLEGSR